MRVITHTPKTILIPAFQETKEPFNRKFRLPKA